MEYEIEPTESVSTAVVRAVSAVEGREPGSIGPLADVLDPDALDALFESRDTDQPRIGGRLSFVFSGCRVTVENGEYLTIEPLAGFPVYRATEDPTVPARADEWTDRRGP